MTKIGAIPSLTRVSTPEDDDADCQKMPQWRPDGRQEHMTLGAAAAVAEAVEEEEKRERWQPPQRARMTSRPAAGAPFNTILRIVL
jgi:hypothetical protein